MHVGSRPVECQTSARKENIPEKDINPCSQRRCKSSCALSWLPFRRNWKPLSQTIRWATRKFIGLSPTPLSISCPFSNFCDAKVNELLTYACWINQSMWSWCSIVLTSGFGRSLGGLFVFVDEIRHSLESHCGATGLRDSGAEEAVACFLKPKPVFWSVIA